MLKTFKNCLFNSLTELILLIFAPAFYSAPKKQVNFNIHSYLWD